MYLRGILQNNTWIHVCTNMEYKKKIPEQNVNNKECERMAQKK